MTTATLHRPRRFPIFWIVAALIALGLALFAYEASRVKHALTRDAGGALTVAERASDTYLAGLEPVLATIDGSLGRDIRAPLAIEIDASIDAAFAPVYARVDGYLDFHYSLRGSYTEIVSTLSGQFTETMRQRLFDIDTLDPALKRADRAIATRFDGALAGSMAVINASARKNLALTETDVQRLGETGLITVVQADALDRFSADLSVARTAGAVAGSAALLRGTRMLATRMARRVAAKVGTRAAGRLATGSGSAATGAGIGSALGPVGTVIGGAAGAVAGWLATDAIIIRLDEALNRDDFRRELITLIDGQRDNAKVAALTKYETLLDAIATDQKAVFRTPAERFLTRSL